MNTLLSVKNLTVAVGSKILVDHVSFEIAPGEILGLTGGSGSGKTTIGLSLMRLLPAALNIQEGSSISFEGKNLLNSSHHVMRQYRGRHMAMIFQEPLAALDPLFAIGQKMDEVLVAHTSLCAQERRQQILKSLSQVGLSDPERVYTSFPHQLSGGMRQRAMIAQAIVCGPSLIIADEPTSSLDVTLQVQIMALLKEIRAQGNISFLLISHDLGMLAHVADRIMVCQEGKIIEEGGAQKVMESPQHPYTKSLVEAFL